MLNELLELDRELFLFLNSFHAPWLDPIMVFVTDKYVWTPLYIILLYLVFKNLGRDGWMALVGITVTIVLADQVTSTLMKPYFARLRPSHEPLLQSLVHIVDGYKGARYGFASSHAANTFGAATFFFYVVQKKVPMDNFHFSMGGRRDLFKDLSRSTLSRRHSCRRTGRSPRGSRKLRAVPNNQGAY